LSRDVAEAFDANADGLILMNHGLITWGDSVQEAYERHIALVSKAEAFLECGGHAAALVNSAKKSGGMAAALQIRGKLNKILEFDESKETLAFVNRPDLQRISQIGAATPDHLLHTKRFPLVLDNDDAFDRYVERYTKWYRAHPTEFDMLDPNPRVILVPGIGMWTAGKDARAARIVRDIYRHTMRIITAA